MEVERAKPPAKEVVKGSGFPSATGGGEGGYSTKFIRGGPALGPTPYAFVLYFDRKGTSFVYL